MTLNFVLPLGKESDLKSLIFSILSKEYPLKTITLVNYIKKRYGRSVTYQAVRKAILALVDEGVLVQEKSQYKINKKWIITIRQKLDEIHADITKEKTSPQNVESIKGEISVFTFDSINKMMKFWENFIADWFANFQKGDANINCFQGAHSWEGLLHADSEHDMMGGLKKKGIKSYALSIGNTPLDRYIWKFYRSIGLKVGFSPSHSSFDNSYYVGTYGENIVQTTYPVEIVKLLENFFKKHKSIETMNLKELAKIVNKKTKVKLTIIKNLEMAKQINKSIIEQIE